MGRLKNNMMEQVEDAGHYKGTLDLKNTLGGNKSVVLFKMTSSGDKSLTNYLKFRNSTTNKLNVQFSGSEGYICIPGENGSIHKFKFSINANDHVDKQSGVHECLRHKKQARKFQRLGPIRHKICVHANEDIYGAIKQKMVAAEQERRSKRTRTLDWFDTNGVNKKGKVTRHKEAQNVKVPNDVKKVTENQVRMSTNILLMRKPLKERMIHMLAVKPYTRQELFDNVNKISLQNNDTNRLTTILLTIAQFRQGMWYLREEKWGDVQENWPFYTEDEKELVRKRKPQSSDPDPDPTGMSEPESDTEPEPGEVLCEPESEDPALNDFREVLKHDPVFEEFRKILNGQSSHDFDYFQEFESITSVEQRREYKVAFEKHYDEYLRLHELLEDMRKTFEYLGDLRKEFPIGDERFNNVTARIMRKYKMLKKDALFKAAKNRFDYLHGKLDLIKTLVQEYDDKIMSQ